MAYAPQGSTGLTKQYADDTTLILDGSKESLICEFWRIFSLFSGLKLNNRKTKLFGSRPIKIEVTNYALEKKKKLKVD